MKVYCWIQPDGMYAIVAEKFQRDAEILFEPNARMNTLTIFVYSGPGQHVARERPGVVFVTKPHPIDFRERET